MSGRRLPVLIILVAGLVAVVALVAHGRPLAASTGHGGVPLSFWNYVATTAIILFALGVLFLLAMLLGARVPFTKPRKSGVAPLLRSLLALFVFGVVVAYLLRHTHHVVLHPNSSGGNGGVNGVNNSKPGQGTPSPHFVWLEAVIVFGLIVVAIAVFVALRPRDEAKTDSLVVAPEAVAEALDESLDDLRTDPDVRRAIVAAYARMETALRVTGLPRRPAEAPLEYLERALLTLDTSGPSVRRLTELFEWAKFSHHEPEPTMRDEAIEALVAVRDELRAPVPAAEVPSEETEVPA